MGPDIAQSAPRVLAFLVHDHVHAPFSTRGRASNRSGSSTDLIHRRVACEQLANCLDEDSGNNKPGQSRIHSWFVVGECMPCRMQRIGFESRVGSYNSHLKMSFANEI